MIKINNLILIFFITLSCSSQNGPNKSLFRIYENGKFGYINQKGKIIIKPVFLNLGDFSEGVAYARTNGTYGYINRMGKFIIEPQFDYANNFKNGIALVYKNGNPFYINTKGEKAFECEFKTFESFNNGRALVKTESGKFGFINIKGELFIDTLFSKINTFNEGLTVVYGINHYRNIGVIDTMGKFIIPYGKYREISNLENGYFKVTTPAETWDTIEGYTSKDAITDKNGKIIFSINSKNGSYLEGVPYSGLTKIWLEDSDENKYESYINLKGEIINLGKNYNSVESFSNNRAIVRDQDWNYSIIKPNGKKLKINRKYQIHGEQFYENKLIISFNDSYGIIDTNGNYIVPKKHGKINQFIDNYYFFSINNSYADSQDGYLYGIGEINGDIIINEIMNDYDKSGFHNGLLKCIIKNKLTFINKQGKIIWQAKKSNKNNISNLNIDFMNRGYFYAYSKAHKNDIGGFGSSKNTSSKNLKLNLVIKNSLSIVVDTNFIDTINNKNYGFNVYIINSTKNKILFSAQDSRLYMNVQAKNKDGKWYDIEYLPSSWCGNSYHTLTLRPKRHWKFKTPIYNGDLKTNFRIKLKYKSKNKGENNIIYSNEYDGSINSGQFWRKQGYSSNGIMDPYND